MRRRSSSPRDRIEHGDGVVSHPARSGLDTANSENAGSISLVSKDANSTRPTWRQWLSIIVMVMPLMAGCDGCRWTQSPDETADDETTKLPAFTSRPTQAYPISRADAGTGGSPDGFIKPGHWTTVGFALRSNRDDRRGFVQTSGEALKPSSEFIDANAIIPAGEVNLPDSITPRSALAKSIVTQRPVVLPKGQLRRFDTRMLAPMEPRKAIEAVAMGGEFVATDSTSRMFLEPSRFAALQAQTYFMVVLTDRAERFTRLQTADWVRPYQNDLSFYQTRDNYRIVIPPTEGVLPIAETALDWTSTSVLFWDDLPTRALTRSQSTAIVDWLHFGGTLVVNGVRAADALSDKAWAPYLPIVNDGSEELAADPAAEFLRSLSVPTDLSIGKIVEGLQGETPEITLAGSPHVAATPIGNGGILWERRVGRGRVVQSRIDLLSDWITSWTSYDSFFNTAILARPPRQYRVDQQAMNLQREANEPVPQGLSNAENSESSKTADADGLPPLRQYFVGVSAEEVHPAINTNVRFASRDSTFVRTIDDVETIEPNANEDDVDADETPTTDKTSPLSAWIAPQLWTHPVSGLGGWKDDSPLIVWCRETLVGEVGMSIPDSKLVFRSLLIYLIVLIPINYIVFRLLGRLEWAWLAVVPLSVLGALYVARAAQLDVGFARSRNEIAMLEIPRDHSRGHLTRVLGLYNSLASQYRIDFDSPDAAISVIESKSGQRNDGMFTSGEPELKFGYEAGIAMQGIAVGSNSFRALHVEQFIDVEGAIRIDRNDGERLPHSGKVLNQSNLNLLDGYLVERDMDGVMSFASIGELSSNGQKSYQLNQVPAINAAQDLPMGMSDVIERLMSPANTELGSAKLIARIDQPLGGLTISPDCQQVRSQTVVVVHLDYPHRPAIQPDENLKDDFRPKE
ncbi:hypothetical protein [Neorhodopirellula pilleata]|uniref:Transmembrane protein n=1 Tax=Neorhodopirellula pilleata TaxID=2714738 RepID=A0A5C6A982_9BACT|nr:hypothetical protein [Neorhodopirellula pilleata]TWT95601.1 hypothetical protein Pla100_32420 [Neorhodopirellula pilleata]